ncbi:MAG: hypothetical protein J5518_03980 [Lachnospiraceae bacterium]|nr:hypothetical protein [Lachnospiraceae bacterium]
MLALRITNIKEAMRLLLDKNETAFDSFLLAEASFTTYAQMTIDGHFHPEFYSAAELDDMKREAEEAGRVFSTQMIRWAQAKSQCFEFIKGTHTPLRFLITLYLAEENIVRFLAGVDTTLKAGDIAGLSLNLKYDGSNLVCTCAASLNIFSTDRSVEHAWDAMVRKFFDKYNISYEEM